MDQPLDDSYDQTIEDSSSYETETDEPDAGMFDEAIHKVTKNVGDESESGDETVGIIGEVDESMMNNLSDQSSQDNVHEEGINEASGSMLDEALSTVTDDVHEFVSEDKAVDAFVENEIDEPVEASSVQASEDNVKEVEAAESKINYETDHFSDEANQQTIISENEINVPHDGDDDALTETVQESPQDIPLYLTEEEKSNWSQIKTSFDILENNPLDAKSQFDNLNKMFGGKSYISMYGSALALERLSVQNAREERNAIQAFRALVNFGKKLPMELMKPSLEIVVRLLIKSGRERMAVSTLEKYLPFLPDDQQLKLLLVNSHIHNDDPDSAIKSAADLDQDSTDVKVLIAQAYKIKWEKKEDVEALENAIKSLHSIKEKSPEVIIMLGELLQRSGNEEKALQVYSDGVESGALPSITQRPLSFTPGLTAQPVWGGRQVPDISKEEKDSIMNNIVDKGLFGEMDGDLTKEGVWGYYSLAANGKWLQEECRVVKELCSKLQDSGYGATGQVYVSVLHPSTSTWTHTAPDNTHLHVLVPVSGAANLRLAEFNLKLQDDAAVIDPSFEKEFTNSGTVSAVLLVVSIPHPDLKS